MNIITDTFVPEVEAYASKLLEAGFTVYLPDRPEHNLNWFHYSIEVDGQVCYGIYHGWDSGLTPPHHTMPIEPSRLNGSSAYIGGQWGDETTLDIDNLDKESVEYARLVARPSNWCPNNAEPTPEALEANRRAQAGGRGVPQRFYGGARLANAKPWGIGTRYLPAVL